MSNLRWLDSIMNSLQRTNVPARRRRFASLSATMIPCDIQRLESRVLLSASPGVEALVNTTIAGTQRTHTQGGRSIDVAADDSYVVTWSSTTGDGSGWGVFARRFDANGNALGGEIAVNTTTANDQNNSAVAVRDDGSFVITWQSRLQDGNALGIYAQQFDSTGAKVGGEILVNTTTVGNQQLPAIDILDGGGFAITWSGRGVGDANGVYARVFDSSGAAVTGEISVNVTKEFAQVYASITADSDGGFAVVWQGNGGSDRKNVMFRHFDSTGAALSGEVVVNQTTDNIQKTPSIDMTTDGNFIVAWSGKGNGDNDGIFARRIDGAGNFLGNEILVNSVVANKQTNPSITATAGNGFGVAWAHQTTGDNFDIAYREFDGTDTALAADVTVNATLAGRQWNPTVAATSNGVRAAWSGRGIGDSFGVFDPLFGKHGGGGGPPAVQNLVNTTTQGLQRTHTQGGRSVSTAADGSYVVTWSSPLTDGSSWGVYLQRYNSSGAKVGGETLVNTTTVGAQNNSAVAVRPDGSFVVTWQSEGQDGSGWGIYAQRYAANGTKVGGEFLVNTTTAGNQQLPVISILSGGGFAIAWSGGGPGDALGVFAKVYDSNGVAVTGEIAVNTTTAFNQTYPTIAADNAGGFAVAWQGNGGSDRKNVMFRSFDGTGAATSAETVATVTTAGIQKTPSIAWTTSGNYVVAWSGNGAGDSDGVFARRINVDGSAASGEILVDATPADKQTNPSVIGKSGGGFAVAWAEVTNPILGSIWVREFDSANNAVGTQTQVDAGPIREWSPTIASIGTKELLVWSGMGTGDLFGIRKDLV